MSVKDSCVVLLDEEQTRLVVDLLDGYILTLEDSKRTIRDIPELAHVAASGYEQVDELLILVRRTREAFA